MKLEDLLDNPEFCFNVRYRIVKYTPTKENPDHVDILYETASNDPFPAHLMKMYISAINQDLLTGIVDLECY